MDIKRIVLAIALSMIVLGGWTYFFQPQYTPPPQQEQADSETAPAASSQKNGTETRDSGMAADASGPAVELGQSDGLEPARAMPAGRDITVDTPLYTAVINTDGGVLKSFKLHKYQATIEPGSPDVNLVSREAAMARPMELLLGGEPVWQDLGQQDIDIAEGGQPATLTLKGVLGDVIITRQLTFNADSYLIEEDVVIVNNSQNRLKGSLGFTLDTTALSEADNRYNLTRVAAYTANGLDEEDDIDDLREAPFVRDQGLKWGGVASNYFLVALLPPEPQAEGGPAFKASAEGDVYNLVLDKPLGIIEPGAEQTYECIYYLGPKDQEVLDGAPNDLGLAVNLGWFDFIAKPLLVGLNIINGFVGNYGLSIIILTIFIKIILWPLSHKSYKSMNQMKKLQPMMSKIREKYKDDRQKMNEEMMNLYKTYKVNPAGGCLPMVLQIPVFIGLYQALLNSLELRHAPFITHLPFTDMIWIADLSAKDPYYITPIVMGATMFLQQKMTPSPGDPTQAKIMLFMPIFFTFIFLNFPAGLVVYWLANNVLSIAQQWWMLKKS